MHVRFHEEPIKQLNKINAQSAGLRSLLCFVRVLNVYMSTVDWNNSAPFYGSPLPQIKLGGPSK